MSVQLSRVVALLLMLTLSFAAQAEDEKGRVVKSFKLMAANYIASFKTDNRAWVVPQTRASTTPPFETQTIGYSNVWFGVLPDYGIDIQASSSIMSPYIGTIDYKVVSYTSKPAPTQDAAVKDFVAENTSAPRAYRNTYAYQDGEWVLVSKKMESLGQWLDVKKP